ncbi:formylglycine-generating enzyme family protein [Nostoc sp. FACHB-87]|uniref:formylglycine-generating enzyme family protein n=1 Tax=Nostocaceae TaxID=1162 RepID=UPI001684DAE0|nr:MULTISPECIES: formylglycine-generating enzyme family protein [Nostocaceae]MBD2455832.1 formylglycine-generating enzyme family protein [Nostoc sp. FACHB-87]MBD2478418.1 formylglycine-generating enzyme family protein [Anabaena sp. FACHB-83]
MFKSRKSFLGLWLITGVAIALSLITPPAFATSSNSCPAEMVMIPGGTFTMGSDNSGYLEELSAQEVKVSSFCIDRYEVTNAQFAAFVKATGYVTIAERPLPKEQFPDLPDEQRLPGSLVFEIAQPGAKYLSWWHWQTGANWQHPFGVESAITNQDNYPVVHIAYTDALAYAQWAGKSLPTEAQWEYAAHGGLDNATYTWGDQYSAKKANTWQGIFPFFNTKKDGYVGIAPVGSFSPNGYGLYDMTGNVWEWTSDWFQPGHNHKTHTLNPTGPETSFDPNKPTEIALHVIKGGSYLCAPNYCSRFRPAARESQAPDTGTTHIGFRLVMNLTTERMQNEV